MPIPLKNKVKNYDNTLAGLLINHVENPDSIGFINNVWYSPKYDKRYKPGAFDPKNFGIGIDRKENEYVKTGELKFHKDKQGKEYLTIEEERNARNHAIANAEDSYKERLKYAQKVLKSQETPSEVKKAVTLSAIYNLGQGYVANNLFEDKPLMNAFLKGTDLDYSNHVNRYFEKENKGDRGKKTNEFIENYLRQNNKKQNVSATSDIEVPAFRYNDGFPWKAPQNYVPSKVTSDTYNDGMPTLKSEGGQIEKRKLWDDLSIAEKSEMMKVAIQNGITSLKDIRSKYNEFAEGGPKNNISDGQYYDIMEKVAEQNYKDWGYNNPDEALVHILNDNVYNYRGYYNEFPNGDGNALDHWPDKYKTAYHRTFSDESVYSGKVSEYNPTGRKGGHWLKNNYDFFIPSVSWNNKFAEGGPEEKGEEEKKPQDKRDTEDNFIDKVIKKAAVLTRPGRYAADRVLHTADILGAPTHVTNALRDLNIFTANQPIILANALYNRLSGKSNSLANAYKEADTHPSKLASMFEVYPAVNTNKNYSEDELAAQYELRKNSSGKPGAITASGYKKLNDGRYAGDIDTASFFSPMKVNEWSLGQTSGKNINGENYTSDIFAYDLNDTKDQYIPRFFDSTGSGVMRLRALFGILGSKGYDDNTNSATAIRTLIPTPAQRSAYEKIKEEKLEEKSKNNKKATGGPLNEQSTENSGTATPLMTILEKKRSNMFVPVFENMDNSNKLPVTNDVKVEPEDPNIYKILSRDTDKYLIDAARKLEIENRENRNKSTIDYLKSLNKDEVKAIQRKIADSGFYDNELNIRDVNKIKAIQRNLVNKGYLHGEKEIDGIIGEKTKAAYTKYIRDKEVDGIVGKKTIAGYLNLNNQSQKEDTWNQDVSTQNIDGCAQWVTKKFEDAVGPLSKQNGVISNAWQMPQNVVDAGGKYIYNIYNDPVFSNIKDVADLKKKTAAALKNNPIDYSSIRVGDIVGIYMPSSNMHSTALKDGTTKNTHVGIVTGIDKDGIPIVEHNIHGIHKKDKANNLTGSLVGKPVIATVSRPKNSNEYIEPIFYENKESKFTIPKKYDNDEIKEFANSMAGAADQIKKIFPTVDIDAVQKIALAVQKRETNYMTNKVSDRGIVSKAFEGAKEFYKYNRHLLNPVLGTNFSKENEENKSSNLAKFKLSSLSQAERNFLNIHSKKDLENPTKAGLAALYYLSKNYDYFKRLQTAYPNLGITDADIEGLTILSYNQGMSKLSHIGFNEKTGKTAKEELESIRYLSNPDTKIKDITSTNWKHLGKLGKVYYDNFKGAFTPYIASAKKELSNITEGLPIQADENSLVAQNKNSKSFGGPIVQIANKFDGNTQPTQQMDRGNRPLYDGQIGFGFGYNPETFERYYTGFYNPYNNSYNNATWTDENNEYNIGLPTVTIRPSGESMVNRAQEKAAPVVRDVLLGSAALAGGIPTLANALGRTSFSALRPGGAFWTNPLTQQMAAGTLAAEGINTGVKAITPYNSVGEGIGSTVESVTGWNPNNTWLGPIVTEAFNPGWYVSPTGVMNAVGKVGNAVGKGLNKASTFMASPYTGKWTTVGNRQYRLSPNSLGANGVPIESRKIEEYFKDIDLNKMRNVFEDYEKSLTQYKGSKLPSRLEFNYEMPKIDFDNLVKDDFVDYLSQQTGRTVKRVPIKDTEHGKLYKQGFSFVDDEGKELAYIAGRKEAGDNVWVGASYVDPEFRHQGLGKQMYFDFNDHVFNTYGTTLHSSPYQRVGSTGAGLSPSNRLWKSLREKGLSSFEGEGLNRYDVMAEPSKITTAYRTPVTPTITPENAASITPEQWTAAQDAAIARGDMAEAQRLRDLHFKVSAPNTKVKEAVFNGSLSDKPFYEFNTNFRNAYWGGRDDYTTGAWFGTGDENTLLSFAGDNPNRLKKFYLNFSNPFIKDAGYRRWDKLLPFNMTEEDITIEAAKLREKGFPEYVIEDWKNGLKTTTDNYALKLETTDYDSGIIKNVYENKAYPDSEYGVVTDYIASKPNQIKSADAVTYDDKGVRIPLGKRDNFKLSDIRYGLIPLAIGLSAYGLYNENQTNMPYYLSK